MEAQNVSHVCSFTREIYEEFLMRENFCEILRNFKTISNYEARVEFCAKALGKHPDILPQLMPSAKSVETSLKYRKEGNSFYVQKDIVKAMELYNMALLHAPPDSVELGYCYGNRSASLFRMKNYGDCLKDISRALEFCTDRSLEEKLLQRRSACVKIYQPIGRDEVGERIRRGMFSLPSRINPLAPCFSADLQISRSPKYGRHILAAADIHPGDVLAAENTNMIFPFEEHYRRICYACYKKNDAMIPCRSCNYVMFCDEECRLKSWNGIHKIECYIMHLLADNKLEKLGNALQATIIARCSHNSWKDFMTAIKNEEEKWKSTEDPNVAFFFSFSTNEQNMNTENMFFSSFQSAVLLHYLEKDTRFFSEFSKTTDLIDSIEMDPPIRKKYVLFTGGVLLRYYVVFYCNSFAIRSHGTENNLNWARALYPFSSNFNHSCAYNAFWMFDGITLVIKAVRPVKKGQQIFITYKYIYSLNSYEMRQDALQRAYGFKCDCEACTNRWPILSDLPKNNSDNLKPCLLMLPFMLSSSTNSPNMEYLASTLDKMYKKASELEEFAPCFEFEMNIKCITACWNMLSDEKYL